MEKSLQGYTGVADATEEKHWELADVLDLRVYDSASIPPASDTESSSSALECATSENNQITDSERSASTD